MFIKFAALVCAVGLSAKICASSHTPKIVNSLQYPYEKTQIVPGFPGEAYKFTLKNGLQVIIVPDMRNPLATLHFVLDAGSNREKKGATGLAHFFEHMMFRKAKGAPEGNYDKVINSVGGSGNAGTSDSFVTFYSNFPAPALETMLKLESDRFLNLDITEPYFSIEKGAVISERKLRVENDPLARSQEKLRALTEINTPLEWMTIGSKSDVENMSLSAAKEFYKNFYTPDNTLLVVGGPVKPLEAIALVEKYFGNWSGKLTTAHEIYPSSYYTRSLGKTYTDTAAVQMQKFQIIYPSKQSSLQDFIYSLLFQSMLDDDKEGTFSHRLIKQRLATQFSFYQAYWQNQTSPFLANFLLTPEQNILSIQDFWLNNVKRVFDTPLSAKIKRQVLKQMAVNNAETSEKVTSLVSSVIDSSYFLNDFNAAQKSEIILKETTDAQFKSWMKLNLNDSNFYTLEIKAQKEKK